MSQVKLKRTYAFLIDLIIVSVVTSLIQSIFQNIFEPKAYVYLGISIRITYGFSLVIYFLYFALFDVFRQGRTTGKNVVKIKVVFNEKKQPSNQVLLHRSALKLISILILPIAGLLFAINEFTIQDYFTKSKTIILK